MVMRIGGLASGMDIDALVEKLMNAERAPLNKLQQKKTTYEWQRDAYRSVNTKLKTFDKYIADNLVLKTLNSKAATSSNSSLVSATATGSASGTLSIEGVSQLATAAKAVGTQQPVTSTTKLSSLFTGNMPTELKLGSINAQGKLGEAVSINIDENTTIDQFIKKVNSSSAGVSAVFENGQLSITAKNTGRVATGESAISMDAKASEVFGKLGISMNPQDVSGIKEGQNARFVVNGIATERSSNAFSLNGYNVTLTSTFNETDTHNKFGTSAIKVLETAKSQLDITFDALKTAYNVNLDGITSNEDKYTSLATALNTKIDGQKDDVKDAEADLKTAGNVSFGTQDAQNFLNMLTEEQKTKFQSKALSESEITALNLTEDQKNAYDSLTDQDKKSLTKTAGKAFNSLSADAKAVLSTMAYGDNLDSTNLSDDEKTILSNLSATELSAVKNVYDKNAQLTSAKQELKNTTNDLNGLNEKYTALQTAEASVANSANAPTQNNVASSVNLSSTTNVDEMMNKIKEFVTTYNGLIKDLNDQTKEAKYRDYAPLTAEQKKDMEENEIKLWEEKAKSGLLRNDSLIRDGLANMRSLIYQSNPGLEGSKYNTLFNIGITTSKSYNDGGTLEIDEDKLRKAIEEDPDAVERLFKNSEGKKDDVVTYVENGVTKTKTVDTRGYLYQLRDSMKAMEVNIEKKAGRSTMTDAQYSIGKSLIDNEKRIDTWQAKLKNIEARYWKQFTAMETAINKANQQSSMFMQG
ncbi:flagellar filament capping protein FliD [Solibacillus silvestris]|uniref:flagellar filament capping protein FliD n=1 Tax=Solibacillus silvestris TaxID=76853 RepID=UPI003F7EBC75